MNKQIIRKQLCYSIDVSDINKGERFSDYPGGLKMVYL